jgi:hypothetical protein
VRDGSADKVQADGIGGIVHTNDSPSRDVPIAQPRISCSAQRREDSHHYLFTRFSTPGPITTLCILPVSSSSTGFFHNLKGL